MHFTHKPATEPFYISISLLTTTQFKLEQLSVAHLVLPSNYELLLRMNSSEKLLHVYKSIAEIEYKAKLWMYMPPGSVAKGLSPASLISCKPSVSHPQFGI